MLFAWGALGLALLLTFLWGAQRLRGPGTGPADETRFAELAQLRQLRAELEQLSQAWDRAFAEHTGKLQDLETAVDHGIRQVTRQENRIRGVVRRAREELAEGGFSHPALEAEASDCAPCQRKWAALVKRLQGSPATSPRNTSQP